MRKVLLFWLVFVAAVSFAVPAKKGIRQTITLTDGTQVTVELRGDEHAHWWQSDDGQRFLCDSTGAWKTVTEAEMAASSKKRAAAKRRMAANHRALAKSREEKRAAGTETAFKGQKRGLIILVNFSDTKFDTEKYGATQALYDSIANFSGYNNHGFHGSISDYFQAQSGGQFLLNFDVAGPVTLSRSYRYYGGNDDEGYDEHPLEMVREACLAVDSDVDFSKYDWDGDGVAEEVFVLYAGHGENDTNNDNLIWPHMDNLSNYTEGTLTLDGVTIDTYACTSELQSDGSLAGIGTFCHEFSHCMGFPDMYDTSANGRNYGMGSWDLMCSGSYNGDTYVPAGYSGYEKMVCGWTKPIELNADTTITGMKPLADMGQTYIVYNKGNNNEYYILENRQRKGFDAALPGRGMLIEHIDYNEDIWHWNVVNSTDGVYYIGNDDTPYNNDHQRITVFHSGNEASDVETAYPLSGNNSLTDTSVPAAEVWNANSDGSYLMHCASNPVSNDSVLFKETFDQCKGTGGNDGQFYGNIASAVFLPDNAGWNMASEIVSSYLYGADKCARFGNGSVSGAVYTPAITLPGDTLTMTFRVACWDATKEGTRLEVSAEGNQAVIVGNNDFTMQKGKWTSYTLRIVGTGSCRILFSPSKRFFLDDVVIKKLHPSPTTAIRKTVIALPWSNGAVYTIDGRYVGTDLNALPHGVYIVGGKKVVR